MCGICGIVSADPKENVDPRLISSMCQVMRHRGPDDEGVMTAGAAGLGMRRLSIIDVAGGHQPMTSEDGMVTVVCNGEIYNYIDLRHGLQNRGHRFSTRSDIEAIAHLYEEMGR